MRVESDLEFRVVASPPVGPIVITAIAGLCSELGVVIGSAHPLGGTLLAACGLSFLYWRIRAPAEEWIAAARRYFRPRVHVIPSVLMLIVALLAIRPGMKHGFEAAGTGLQDSKKAAASDDYEPGIILVPEAEAHTVLVPPIPALAAGLDRVSPGQPLSIPFYGVYHIFRRSDRRLPGNSVQKQGSPTKLRFRSSDGSAVAMEAHQNLGAFFQTTCCASIKLHISNTDPYRTSVALEVVLADTERKQAKSLGRNLVEGTASEILEFRMPNTEELSRFDEITIRFHLAPQRAQHSAKIAVEKFTLVPR